MSDPLITIYTQAYNTENYIRRCVESVLNQSYSNWQYILIDNGSEDQTDQIIQEYARREPRIIYLKRHQDAKLIDILSEYCTGEYFMTLDSDDYLALNCLTEVLPFTLKHNLDITVFGSQFCSEETGDVAYRMLEENQVWRTSDSSFVESLPVWHQFVRALWAKLYRVELLPHMQMRYHVGHGADTLCVLDGVKAAASFGIKRGYYHYYTIRKKSFYSAFHEGNFDAAELLLVEFQKLITKPESNYSQCQEFLYSTFCADAYDQTNTLFHSQLAIAKKLEIYKRFLEKETVQHVFSQYRESPMPKRLITIAYQFLMAFYNLDNKALPITKGELADIIFCLNPAVYSGIQHVKDHRKRYIIDHDPDFVQSILLEKPEDAKLALQQIPSERDTIAIKLCGLSVYDEQAFVSLGLQILNTDLEQELPNLFPLLFSKFGDSELLRQCSEAFIRTHKDIIWSVYQQDFIGALEAVVTLRMEAPESDTTAQTRKSVSKGSRKKDPQIKPEEPAETVDSHAELLNLGLNLAALTQHTGAFLFLKRELLIFCLAHSQWTEARAAYQDLLDIDQDLVQDLELSEEQINKMLAPEQGTQSSLQAPGQNGGPVEPSPPCLQTDILSEDLIRIYDGLSEERALLKGKTVLITGFAGSLGFMLCQFFAKYGEQLELKRVYCLDNYQFGKPEWVEDLAKHPLFQIQEGDITTVNLDFAYDANLIFHMASLASPVFYRLHPIETMDADVIGLRRLLEFYQDRNIFNLLFYSTSEVYGDPDPAWVPTPEAYRGSVNTSGPRACYDESKRFGETLCYCFHKYRQVPVTVVRPFNSYGPGLRTNDQRVVADFAENILKNEDLVIYSDGRATRTFCYVTDTTLGCLKAILHGTYDMFNIGMDMEEMNIHQLAEHYQKIGQERFHYQGKIVYQQHSDCEYLTDNPQRRCPNLEKSKKLLNYHPTVPVEEGIFRYLRFLTEQNMRRYEKNGEEPSQ